MPGTLAPDGTRWHDRAWRDLARPVWYLPTRTALNQHNANKVHAPDHLALWLLLIARPFASSAASIISIHSASIYAGDAQ